MDLVRQEHEQSASSLKQHQVAGYAYNTKLERWIVSRGVRPVDLARESGYSRQHLVRVRAGRMEPTRRCMKAIIVACRRLARVRVKAGDLFDLG
ncbi:MAG: hypothetical protein AABO58_00910 [Acidobacteriota bacterium]